MTVRVALLATIPMAFSLAVVVVLAALGVIAWPVVAALAVATACYAGFGYLRLRRRLSRRIACAGL